MRVLRHPFHALTVALAAAALLGLVACGSGEREPEGPDPEQWSLVQEAHTQLTDLRQQIADLRTQLTSETPEGEEAPPAEEIEAQIDTLAGEVGELQDKFNSQLVGFINTSIENGFEESEPFLKALDMKIEEDILLAQEYIDEGGEYGRAIDILNATRQVAPEHPRLLEAIASAEELRYMTEERFALVKKGMTQEEVRATVGTPKASNVREFPNRNMVGWFYRKEERETIAAVYFRQRGGEWKVDVTDFNLKSGG